MIKKVAILTISIIVIVMVSLSIYVEMILPRIREMNRSTEIPEILVLADKEEISDLFSKRDLKQEVDIDVEAITVEDRKIYEITTEGTYRFTGTAVESKILVTVDKKEKVQLVLDGVYLSHTSSPIIDVVSADKVYVTTTDSMNTLTVAGENAAVYSKDDITFNGLGELSITSPLGKGVDAKDDLKITGGTLNIDALDHGLDANDSLRISGGIINIDSDKDGIHSENNDDTSLGYVYISGGELNITAGDDGIRGTSLVQIDGGSVNIIKATEGIEGTYILINDGNINVYATNDGINAARKSDFAVAIVMNGGKGKVAVASGNTDCLDSNGFITIAGGHLEVTGASTFDADFEINFDGGTVIVNGKEVQELPRSH